MKKRSIWIIAIILIVIGGSVFSPQIDSITHVEVEKIKLYSDFRSIELIDEMLEMIQTEIDIPVTYVDHEEDADIILKYGSKFDTNEFTSIKADRDEVKFVVNNSIDIVMNFEDVMNIINSPQTVNGEKKIIISPRVLECLESKGLIIKENAIISDNLNETIATDSNIIGLLFDNEIVSNDIQGKEIVGKDNQDVNLKEDINLLIKRDSKYFNELNGTLEKLQLKVENNND